jgi:hypothetical protein
MDALVAGALAREAGWQKAGATLADLAREVFTSVEAERLHREKTDARLDAIEALPSKSLADCYRGVYRAGDHYARGELATDRGSLHICLKDTTDRPGASGCWQCCAKGGKDGKDIR